MYNSVAPSGGSLTEVIFLVFGGTTNALLQEMRTLTEVLVHSESDIRNSISNHMQVSDMLRY